MACAGSVAEGAAAHVSPDKAKEPGPAAFPQHTRQHYWGAILGFITFLLLCVLAIRWAAARLLALTCRQADTWLLVQNMCALHFLHAGCTGEPAELGLSRLGTGSTPAGVASCRSAIKATSELLSPPVSLHVFRILETVLAGIRWRGDRRCRTARRPPRKGWPTTPRAVHSRPWSGEPLCGPWLPLLLKRPGN
jgi:hypothetical protein